MKKYKVYYNPNRDELFIVGGSEWLVEVPSVFEQEVSNGKSGYFGLKACWLTKDSIYLGEL